MCRFGWFFGGGLVGGVLFGGVFFLCSSLLLVGVVLLFGMLFGNVMFCLVLWVQIVSMVLIGICIGQLVLEKWVEKFIILLLIISCIMVCLVMLSMIWLFLIVEGGICMLGMLVLIRMCGVSWLLLIYFISVCSRYGWWLVMWKKFLVMCEVYVFGVLLGWIVCMLVGLQMGNVGLDQIGRLCSFFFCLVRLWINFGWWKMWLLQFLIVLLFFGSGIFSDCRCQMIGVIVQLVRFIFGLRKNLLVLNSGSEVVSSFFRCLCLVLVWVLLFSWMVCICGIQLCLMCSMVKWMCVCDSGLIGISGGCGQCLFRYLLIIDVVYSISLCLIRVGIEWYGLRLIRFLGGFCGLIGMKLKVMFLVVRIRCIWWYSMLLFEENSVSVLCMCMFVVIKGFFMIGDCLLYWCCWYCVSG